MTLEQLEAEFLALPKDSQASLLTRLLGHLAHEIDPKIANIWVEEAERRDRTMDDESNSISADRVLQRLRASLQ